MKNPQKELKPLAEMSDTEFERYLFSLPHETLIDTVPAAFGEAISRIKDRADRISKLQKLTQPHVRLGVER